MRGFWALPAVLRVALASQHAFSVQDDVLAYPQFEVTYSTDPLTPAQARSRLTTSLRRGEADVPLADTSSATEIALNDPHAHHDFPQDPLTTPEYTYEEILLDSLHYSCAIPIVDTSSTTTEGGGHANATLSKQDEEREIQRANERGWELLAGMQGSCIYFWSGWWSYRYCYGEGVKQFHSLPPSGGVPSFPPKEDPGVVGFMLGAVEEEGAGDGQNWKKEVVEMEKRKKKVYGHLETRGDNRFLVQRLEGGTVCDLTGKQRRIEVQFHCDPVSSDRISLIQEVATCAYLMVIKTPRLCNDVAFLPPQEDKPNSIVCSPILSPEQIAEDDKHKAEATSHKAAHVDTHVPSDDAFKQQQSKPLPTIGGIIVGAHKYVPLDQKIQKSAVVGGGSSISSSSSNSDKETFLGTIADSKGKVMSAEQLKKLGFGNARNTEELRRKIEEVAAGKQWKLDVWETEDGPEYRAVLIDEEGDEDGEGEGQGEGGLGEEGEGEVGSEEHYMDEL